jgi:hypothetical protein
MALTSVSINFHKGMITTFPGWSRRDEQPSTTSKPRRMGARWRNNSLSTTAMSSAYAVNIPWAAGRRLLRNLKQGSMANANNVPEAGQPCLMPLKMGIDRSLRPPKAMVAKPLL